jgi:hypothetical protein
MVNNRLPGEREQRLGPLLCERPKTSGKSAGEDECSHGTLSIPADVGDFHRSTEKFRRFRLRNFRKKTS